MKISLQNRQFRLWKYSISHSMLLIRSCKNASFSNNIDLYFADVKLIKFHQFLLFLITYLAKLVISSSPNILPSATLHSRMDKYSVFTPEPSPMVSIVITEPTPMMMLSIVSIALVLLGKRAHHAILKRFCIFIMLISELEN